jgi:hypothetical protein
MRTRSMTRALVALCIVAVCVLAASPASAQTVIRRGIDVFQTPNNPPTGVDFSTDPIPAGFFCSGSDPFTGFLQLTSVPVPTVPAGVLNGADTVIERLDDVNLFFGSSGITRVVVRALRLTGNGVFTIVCGNGQVTEWRVDACLCGNQPISELRLTLNSCGCGVANGSLRLNVCLRFTNLATNEVIGPLTRPIELLVQNMPWCPKAGPGSFSVAGPITLIPCDNCDPTITVPGTSNFFPGLTCANQGVDCWTLFGHLTRCHNGPSPTHPHCVNPICGRQST